MKKETSKFTVLYNPIARAIHFARSHLSKERLLDLTLTARLQNRPRFQPGCIKFFGYNWHYVDSLSCLSTFRHIFVEKVYAYNLELVRQYPLILDCGANIGLASFFFAVTSPHATIIAFEPDPVIFQVLQKNISSYSWGNKIKAVNAALWLKGCQQISFAPDGADAGHRVPESATAIKVNAVSLRQYLQQPVGLLKLDIEGAEYEVIFDSVDLLQNVKQIIVEVHSIVGQPQRTGEFIAALEQAGFRVQINNIHKWLNPLIQSPVMGQFDQLLIVYGYRS